jgi:hypothetical protein
MLVVIAILAVLIALLTPALRNARTQARIAICATQIRQLSQICFNYAVTARGVLPDLTDSRNVYGDNSSFAAYWFSRKARDQFIASWGLSRSLVYCPSNEGWNLDNFWNEDGTSTYGSGVSIWGYTYYGNNKNTNDKPPKVNWVRTFTDYPIGPNNIGSPSAQTFLWVDLNRTYLGQFGAGSNHMDGGEVATGVLGPGYGGSNVGHRDGSVEWFPRQRAVQRWWLNSGGIYRCYW